METRPPIPRAILVGVQTPDVDDVAHAASLEELGRLVKTLGYEVIGTAEYQPPVWTAIEFEAPADSSDALAADLSEALLLPAWYANWNSDTEATIVFPRRIFRYSRGDEAGRAEAEGFGRQCGVPEQQLDWTD